MPRNIDQVIIDYLATGKPFKTAFLVLIDFDEPYRLALTTLNGSYTHEGIEFIGLGSLGNVSMPQGDGKLSPKQYEVTLSGISDEVLEAISQLNYLNNLATCWQIFFDEDGVQLGTPVIAWRGLTDAVNFKYGETSSASISIRDRLVDWERPKVELYTNGDQVAKYPNDRFFEFISQVATKEANWPESTWYQKQS